jgi:putative transposase
MPRKGHTEEQIVYALRQAEAGKKVSEIVREMGVSQQAFYSWKRKYAGLGLNELRELRQLRDENRKLKTLVADLTLDKHILQEVLSKRPKARGTPRASAQSAAGASDQRKACLRADWNHALDEPVSKSAGPAERTAYEIT